MQGILCSNRLSFTKIIILNFKRDWFLTKQSLLIRVFFPPDLLEPIRYLHSADKFSIVTYYDYYGSYTDPLSCVLTQGNDLLRMSQSEILTFSQDTLELSFTQGFFFWVFMNNMPYFLPKNYFQINHYDYLQFAFGVCLCDIWNQEGEKLKTPNKGLSKVLREDLAIHFFSWIV